MKLQSSSPSARSRSRSRSPAPRQAQAPEKKDVKLGVGGKTALYYLPLTLCRAARLLQGAGAQRRDQRLHGRRAVAAGAGRRLGRRRHRRLRAHHPHAGQGPGHHGRDRARPLPRHRGRAAQGQGGAATSRPADLKGMKIGVTRARLLHQLVRHVPDGEGRAEARRRLLHRRRHRRLGGRRHQEGRDRRHLQPRSGDHQARAGRRHQDRRRHPHRGGHARHVRRLQPGGGALPQAGLHREEPEHRAGAGQRLLQDAQVAGEGDARSRSPRRCRRNTTSATRRSTSPR